MQTVTKVNNYSKCPNCGYWAFDGSECHDCGYTPRRKRDPLLPTLLAAVTFAVIVLLCAFSSKGQQSDSKAVKTEQGAKQANHCRAITKRLQPCKNYAMHGDTLCMVHRRSLKEATK